MKRQFSFWLVFCGMVAVGASDLSATACTTTCGSTTTGNITLNWRAAGLSGVSGITAVACPPASSHSTCGYAYQQVQTFFYLNPRSTAASPYLGWHSYTGSNNTTSSQSYLNSLVICSTTCSSTGLTFALAGGASLEQGTGVPTFPYRAPIGDAGYYLSTPNTSSAVTITFPSGKFAKQFDFYWGSADAWNSITFTDLNGGKTAYSGRDLCSASGIGCFNFVDPNNTGPSFDNNGVVVDFSAIPDRNGNIHPWSSVTFASSSPAFEFDNIRWMFAQCVGSPCTSAIGPGPGLAFAQTQAPVPEPSSLALMGSGIAGMVMLVRRKSRPLGL